MPPYFSPRALSQLQEARASLDWELVELQHRFATYRFKSSVSHEYAFHGFMRRLGMVSHCISEVFRLIPPELEKIPSRDATLSATAFVQTSMMNVYGCLDNLAWIWVFENFLTRDDGRPLRRTEVGLGSKYTYVWRALSTDLQSLITRNDRWISVYLKEFRDSLAHRIPLYIPPHLVDPSNADTYNKMEQDIGEKMQQLDIDAIDAIRAKQQELVFWRPWITHSTTEQVPFVRFHPQLLNDFRTLREFATGFLDALEAAEAHGAPAA